MILEQYYLGCLAQASYLIADEDTGTAALVDPRRDVDEYLGAAERRGLRIEHVILTHFHADFVSGHLEVRERTGATIYLGRAGSADYPHESVGDGDHIEFGTVRLGILETPGHTPESISIVVYDKAEDADKPKAVLTGDTLFIGDVGRPDLMASIGMTAEDLASRMYDSLHKKLMKLPDETLLYPGHGAGSACGKNLSSDTVSTIGAQRATNYALQPMTRDDFVAAVTTGQSTPPGYFGHDARLNRSARSTLDETMSRAMTPLSFEEVVRRQNAGAQVLDTRDPDRFAECFLTDSTNIGLGGRYAGWAGTVLDQDRPILIVAEPGREEEAILRLGRIGYDHVDGYLYGGAGTLRDRPELTKSFARLESYQLRNAIDAGTALPLLDVRNPGELECGAIAGSRNIPLGQLRERIDELRDQSGWMVYCAGGYRSSIAASILQQHGFAEVQDLIGGFTGWQSTQRVS